MAGPAGREQGYNATIAPDNLSESCFPLQVVFVSLCLCLWLEAAFLTIDLFWWQAKLEGDRAATAI